MCVVGTPAFAETKKTVDCYCTDSTGGRIEIGQSICMTVGGRSFTAQCQMSLNSPMWREMNPGCLSSQSRPLPHSAKASPLINETG